MAIFYQFLDGHPIKANSYYNDCVNLGNNLFFAITIYFNEEVTKFYFEHTRPNTEGC